MTNEPKLHKDSQPATCLVLLISFVIAFSVFAAVVLPPMLGGRWDAAWIAAKNICAFTLVICAPFILVLVFWKKKAA